MNKNLYALAALTAFALPAFSRPASPALQRHTNPDGSVVEYYMNGDEHFHYYTDADRSIILERTGNRMAPMVRDGQTMVLNQANIARLMGEQPDAQLPVSASAGKVSRMAALDNFGRSIYPTLGETRGCVILIEYADTPFSIPNPKEQFTRFCNEKGYSDYGSRGSAKDYFEACSHGKFSPTFDVYGPVKLEHESAWYVGTDDPSLRNSGKYARFAVAIKEAVEYLDQVEGVDFSVYDYDNDDMIDNIFFFFSGNGQNDTNDPNRVWPHQGNYHYSTNIYAGGLGLPQLFVDGKEVVTYATSCELNGSPAIPASDQPWMDGIGAFCHEYSHVLGLPDFYDTVSTSSSNATKSPGSYTVMDSGSYNKLSTCPPLYSAYEKWVCHWLDFTDFDEDGVDITLNAQTSDEPNAYRQRIKRAGQNRYYNEYYIFEARANESWDQSLPDHGMLIWRIDYDRNQWMSNTVNVNGKPRVELIGPKASGTSAWPGEDNPATYITASTGQLTPNCTKQPLDVVISNIYADYDNPRFDKVTFEYNKYADHDLKTVLNSDPSADHDSRLIYLSWAPEPEATEYLLTVKRKSGASAYEQVVDDLDETSVGLATSYIVRNISPAQWNHTFRAYVRVVKGIPSSETSNVITFVPSQLADQSGIDDIAADDIIIYGGKGEIIAPEGARAFNLSGVETGLTDLPAGVYIVTTPKVSAKVVVR